MNTENIDNKKFKNKKVGIVTFFHNNINYGGTLQAYALWKVISNLGYECRQIRYDKTDTNQANNKSLIHKLISKLIDEHKNNPGIDGIIKIIKLLIINGLIYASIILNPFPKFKNKKRQIRKTNFEKFNHSEIPSTIVYNKDTINKCVQDFDLFVCGSDQIWNPNWYSEPYFLSFVPDNIPKISYAASIGIDSLTNEHKNFMRPLIQRLNHISVREEKAVELIKEITNKDVTQLLDPTLLLTADEWNAVASDESINEPYVFSYMLGGNRENRKCASNFAKRKHMKLVTFPFVASDDIRQIQFGNVHNYGGPDEFITLIRDAEYVITDSFHGCVFSIIFHKKFVVLKRNSDSEIVSMNSRLYTLFKIFNIEKQIVSASSKDLEKIMSEIDYDLIDCNLDIWKTKSINWLNCAFCTK